MECCVEGIELVNIVVWMNRLVNEPSLLTFNYKRPPHQLKLPQKKLSSIISTTLSILERPNPHWTQHPITLSWTATTPHSLLRGLPQWSSTNIRSSQKSCACKSSKRQSNHSLGRTGMIILMLISAILHPPTWSGIRSSSAGFSKLYASMRRILSLSKSSTASAMLSWARSSSTWTCTTFPHQSLVINNLWWPLLRNFSIPWKIGLLIPLEGIMV